MRIPLLRRGDDPTPIAWWEWLFAPILWALMVPALFLLVVYLTPYFWLYPDSHMHAYDEGTEQQQALMLRYRRFTSRVPFWRRVGRVLAFPFRRKRSRPSRRSQTVD